MVIYLIIVLGVISRFVPHLANFAPITALAIFSAANLDWKKSVGLTLAARLVSDLFLGFFSWPLMVAVYLSHLVGVLFGAWIKRSNNVIPEATSAQRAGYPESINKIPARPPARQASAGMTQGWLKIIASSLGASVTFFLVTNFAFLYRDYNHNISGILLAYTNGLPFLRGTVLGDLAYTVGMFGGYEIVKAAITSKRKIDSVDAQV